MALIVGRKEIMKKLGCHDWGTVRRWKRRYKLPVRYIGDKPVLLPEELNAWVINFDDIKKSQK